MIQLSNATILAVTKLRTRRIRTIITLVTSSLLFSCLIAALIVAQGSLNSINAFNKLGLGSRYIVQAAPPPLINQVYHNTDVLKAATQIYNQTIATKKAAAKKLDVPYDASTEVNPVVMADPKYGTTESINPTAPAAQQAVSAYIKTHPMADLSTLQTISSAYHPKGLYQTTLLTTGGQLQTMFDGVESFKTLAQDNSEQAQDHFQHDILQNGGLEFAPASLTDPFLLPNSAPTKAEADEIPVVLPYDSVQYLMGTTDLPGNATSAQKLARVQKVYSAASSLTFAGCYRNTASANQIQLAISTAADVAANKNNKTYQKPSLIYGLPSNNSCAAATVLSDTRTASEKKAAAQQAQLDAMFGTDDTPIQQKITFRVVGIIPGSQSNAPSDSAAGILQSLVGSSLSGSAAIPQNLFNALPSTAHYNAVLNGGHDTALSIGVDPDAYYVEFNSAASARSFINNEACSARSFECPTDKPFRLNAFGSNSIAIKDLQNKFAKIFKLAGAVVALLAIVIMSSTVGRMLADGRRETAVFRAVGAERADISVIYGMYTLLLSTMIAILSLGVGTAIGYGIDHYYWRTVTVQAQLAFGGSSQAMQFHLFSIDQRIWLIALVAILCGMISMIFPLLRNIRRSPIKDMRDE